MIDWLLIDILWGWGRKRANVLTVVFLETRLGFYNVSATLIWRLKGTLGKMEARLIVVCNNFQEGFGHHTDQNTLFKS